MDRTRRTLLRSSFAALAAAALITTDAAAHADYRNSNPPDGGTVSSPPSQVWAEFTEPPAESSTLKVYSPCGARVDSGDYSYQGFPINRITVSMSASEAGEYAVEWTVISEADGHTTRGVFTFRSSGGDECPAAGGEPSDGGGAPGEEGSSGGSGRGDGSAPRTEASDVQARDAADDGSASGNGKKGGKRSGGKKAGNPADGGGAEPRGIELTQDQTPFDEPAGGDGDEMPFDWLLVSLALSALIGAAGGRVYAGILGR